MKGLLLSLGVCLLLPPAATALAGDTAGLEHRPLAKGQSQESGIPGPERMFTASSRCFGAATRSLMERCIRPRSTTADISIPPLERGDLRNADLCRQEWKEKGGINVCELGVGQSSASQTFALIGDSHSAHWRPAFDTIARQRGWRVLSEVEGGCDYTEPGRARYAENRDSCRRWRLAIPKWLGRHPEIRTVFMAGFAYQDAAEDDGDTKKGPRSPVAAEKRASARFREVDARLFVKSWKRLPPSVQRVVAIIDNPRSDPDGRTCIRRALRRKRDPGRACAVPRSWALKPDAKAAAARRVGAPRAGVIDVSDAFCDRVRCFPVIGDAQVHADGNHMHPDFNRSLAPWLARAIDAQGLGN